MRAALYNSDGSTRVGDRTSNRRGRGASGPQGQDYTIAKECEDLLTVQVETRAPRVFGHSYGGLVVLETARRAPVFTKLAVYEPAVSVAGSIPTGWMTDYRQLLAAGDSRQWRDPGGSVRCL